MNELTLLDSLFNNAWDRGFANYAIAPKTVMPKVDVTQTNDAYNLQMDLPGRTEKDVNLELDKNILTISSVQETVSEKTDEQKTEDSKNNSDDKNQKWLLRERTTSSFSRRFTLPEDIDSDNVTATFKNGVLNVNITRKAVTAPKQIKITA